MIWIKPKLELLLSTLCPVTWTSTADSYPIPDEGVTNSAFLNETDRRNAQRGERRERHRHRKANGHGRGRRPRPGSAATTGSGSQHVDPRGMTTVNDLPADPRAQPRGKIAGSEDKQIVPLGDPENKEREGSGEQHPGGLTTQCNRIAMRVAGRRGLPPDD